MRELGEYPFSLLASLLEVCEGYFTLTPQEFKKQLRSWEQTLQEYSVEEINALYGQVIYVADQQFYLVEILIEMMSGACRKEKISGLVDWITEKNPSLVSKLKEFDDIYKSKGIGPYFTIKELGQYVTKLDDCRTQRGARQLALLVQRTKVKSEIDKEVVALLRDVYKERWLKIMGGSKDYTRLQGGVNSIWIILAQMLAGAGIIPENYYHFLMPTLTHDRDPVQLEALIKFPLSHFILSEDARQLILLERHSTIVIL